MAKRIDLNTFLKCLVVLEYLVFLSKEFHKIGPDIRIARLENIFLLDLLMIISLGLMLASIAGWTWHCYNCLECSPLAPNYTPIEIQGSLHIEEHNIHYLNKRFLVTSNQGGVSTPYELDK